MPVKEASAAPQKAFFRVDFGSDSMEYRCWVRGRETESQSSSQLWELSLKKPSFPADKIDRRELPVRLDFNEKGVPVGLETDAGKLEIRHAYLRKGISVVVSATDSNFATPPVPLAFRSLVDAELKPGEKRLWWGLPGHGPMGVTTALLILGLGGLLYFSYLWMGVGGLCIYSTPPQWKWPCLSMVTVGAILLGLGGFNLIRTLVRVVRFTPLYLVTNRRVLVLSRNEPAVSYASWEIPYAEVRARRSRTDVLFRTQTVGTGNLWAVRDFEGLQEALSALIR